VGKAARIREKKGYRLLVRNSKGKKPLGRTKRRMVDNIKMDLGEIVLNCVDWIDLAQDREKWGALVEEVLNLWVPWNTGKLSKGSITDGLSSNAQLRIVSP
jgi:hypothetical protein